MTIEIKNIISSTNAISHSDGSLLYQELENKNLTDIVIDFNNIKLVSTAFLNASIGKLAILYPKLIKSVKFLIPEEKSVFQSKIDKVIENALLGDFYDGLVDDASKSE